MPSEHPEADSPRYGKTSVAPPASAGGRRADQCSAFTKGITLALHGTPRRAITIQHPVAQGGICEVWKGTLSGLSQPVAIKIPLPARQNDQSAKDRLAREADFLGTHASSLGTHAPRLKGRGEHQGVPFLALEWIEGHTLLDAVHALSQSQSGCTLDARLLLLVEVAKALAAVHGTGAIHRDGSHTNIMIRHADKTAVYIDFGLVYTPHAGHAPDITQHDGPLGTPLYMPHEVLSPGRAHHAASTVTADIYALGVNMFRVLVGEYPFDLTQDTSGASPRTNPLPPHARFQRLSDALRAAHAKSLGITEDACTQWLQGPVHRVLLAMLHDDPSHRYRDVTEVIHDLDILLGLLPGANAGTQSTAAARAESLKATACTEADWHDQCGIGAQRRAEAAAAGAKLQLPAEVQDGILAVHKAMAEVVGPTLARHDYAIGGMQSQLSGLEVSLVSLHSKIDALLTRGSAAAPVAEPTKLASSAQEAAHVEPHTIGAPPVVRPSKESTEAADAARGWLQVDDQSASIESLTLSMQVLTVQTAARTLADKGEWTRAWEILKDIALVEPYPGTDYALAAFIAHHAGAAHEVVDGLYKKALALRPNDANMLSNYATMLSTQPDRRQQAEDLYHRAISLRPDDANTLSNYAAMLSTQPDRRQQAEDLYRRAISLRPDHADTLNNYALLLSKQPKRWKEAETLYQRALALRPDHAGTPYNYALLLSAQPDRWKEAETLYQQALALRPDHADTLNNYANLLSNLPGRFDEAEELYTRALDLRPDDVWILNNYANLLSEQRGRWKDAEAIYQRALLLRPDEAVTLHNYATLLSRQPERGKQAETLYQRALALRPKNAKTLGSYARYLFRAGKHRKGLATLGAAIAAQDSQDPPALNAELCMYAVCHRLPKKWRTELGRLKSILLKDNVRTGDSDYSGVIAAAEKRRHPEAAWLQPLADVCAGRSNAGTLNGWEAWRNA